MTTTAYFRSPTMGYDGGIGIDRDKGVISGVAIMQIGDISERDGRKFFVDKKTLEQFVALASKGTNGSRARFTHGGESGEGLGSYLGRWLNARIDGDKARWDLHLSPRSHDSLHGDIGKYTIDMSESDPDMLGASMVSSLDFAAMRKEKRSDGYMPIRLRSLHGADIVDTPALVSGMFAAGHETGDDAMSDTATGITQEQFDAGLKTGLESFGKQLAETIMGQVDAKFATFSAKQEEEGEEPTPEELRKEGAKRAAQIFAVAAVSGLADHEKLATEAIEKDFSVETFKASITDRLIASNGLTKDAGDDSDGAKDPHAAFKAEYKADIEHFTATGVSEDSWIRTRCRDEGLPVPPKAA